MIYTKTGDNGTTSLASGDRVRKSDLRIESYGTSDELNSYFGWLGALLAEWGEQLPPDAIQTELPPQHAFILPAGSQVIAAAHICRTVTRRLERLMVRLSEAEEHADGDPEQKTQTTIAIRWVNRLSDYCFVLARKCTILQKKSPVEWKK